jgi:hypothetical protein
VVVVGVAIACGRFAASSRVSAVEVRAVVVVRREMYHLLEDDLISFVP